MAFNKSTTYADSENIVDSEVGLVVKTRQGTQAMAKDEDGRKVIKAGALLAADGYEPGVVLHDYDVTDYAEGYPVAVAVAGRLIASKVAAEVTAKKADLAGQGLYLV